MSLIRINIDGLRATNLKLKKCTSNVISVNMEVSSLRYKVDNRVLARRNIGKRINNTVNSLNEVEDKLRDLEKFVNTAMDNYSNAEDIVMRKVHLLKEALANIDKKVEKKSPAELLWDMPRKSFGEVKKIVEKEFIPLETVGKATIKGRGGISFIRKLSSNIDNAYSFKKIILANSIGNRIELSNKNVKAITQLGSKKITEEKDSVGKAVKLNIHKVKNFYIDTQFKKMEELFHNVDKEIKNFEAEAIKLNNSIEARNKAYISAVGKGTKTELAKLSSNISLKNPEKEDLKRLVGKAGKEYRNFAISADILKWEKDLISNPLKTYSKMDNEIDKYVKESFKIAGIDKHNPIYLAYESYKYIMVRKQAADACVINLVKGLGELSVLIVKNQYDVNKVSFNTVGMILGIVTPEQWWESVKTSANSYITLSKVMVGIPIGIVEDVITTFNPDKAKDFFLNPDATPEKIYGYESALANTVLLFTPVKGKLTKLKISDEVTREGLLKSFKAGDLPGVARESIRNIVGRGKIAAAGKVEALIKSAEKLKEIRVRIVKCETADGITVPAGVKVVREKIEKIEKVEKADEGVSNAGNTVWDNIKITQPMYEGTKIPKSFEITAGGEKFWVHPNGTKHMVEYITKDAMSHGIPMNSQTLLSSFQNSVSGAVKQGINYDKIMNAGNWELIFSKPRGDGLLPVIKHAVYRP